jgi:hypothetical protein
MMKWIALIIVAVIGLFAYRSHMEHVREAQDREADRIAFEKLDRERRAQREADALKARRPSLAISKLIEPFFMTVTAPLDTQKPFDYVPQLEITKQRILDRQPGTEPERAAVYDRAGAVFDGLIALADERTKYLEELLRNKAKTSPFDQPGKTNTSAEFFNRGVLKHWDEAVARYKPTISQRLDALRAAERSWNAKLGQWPSEELYEPASVDPVLIAVDGSSATNGLGNTPANNNGTVTRPWRQSYYNQNGYRYPSFSR